MILSSQDDSWYDYLKKNLDEKTALYRTKNFRKSNSRGVEKWILTGGLIIRYLNRSANV